jgi:hypothetical protein
MGSGHIDVPQRETDDGALGLGDLLGIPTAWQY